MNYYVGYTTVSVARFSDRLPTKTHWKHGCEQRIPTRLRRLQAVVSVGTFSARRSRRTIQTLRCLVNINEVGSGRSNKSGETRAIRGASASQVFTVVCSPKHGHGHSSPCPHYKLELWSSSISPYRQLRGSLPTSLFATIPRWPAQGPRHEARRAPGQGARWS